MFVEQDKTFVFCMKREDTVVPKQVLIGFDLLPGSQFSLQPLFVPFLWALRYTESSVHIWLPLLQNRYSVQYI